MAKISARGDKELARWRSEQSTMILTESGRLLRRLNGLGGYNLLGGVGSTDMERAAGLAAAMDMGRVR